ncbi:FAD-dependent oxidoreductase [Marispirochaeta aestuarii]|uniref:FAD-dependent oxidoreductase n=1 Tax=Marispirochaeta aestuarii TaxID=1963862 RepID=UPI002ABDB022|nr:FAD-dependent oxidoreductase [Marispirochaeta aestuarii]
MTNEHFEVLVIGGGPAAITMAKGLGTRVRMGVIRREAHSMIYCAMPYAVEGLLQPEKTLKADTLVTETGAHLIRDTVTGVDFEKKSVTTQAGNSYTWDKLVIATGAEPVLPPLKGHELEGVSTFKKEEEMFKVTTMVEEGMENAVVIGAGAIGVELAQALAARGVHTVLADMADSVLPNLADPEMTAPAAEELQRLGIRLKLGRKALELRARENNPALIGGVVFDDGSLEKADLVVFAVGMRPEVSLFEGSGLEIARDGIIVDSRMRTSIEDVYAVGDCVSFTSAITGEPAGGKLATNAVPMGRVLAANLKGEDREYPGFINGAATKAGELFVGGTGMKEEEAKGHFQVICGYSEFTTTFPIMPGAKKARLKLLADSESGRIIGGQIVSGQPVTDKIDQMSMAIQFGLRVEDLLNFSYSSQPWQSFYPAHNLLVKAAEELSIQLSGPDRKPAALVEAR